MKKLSIEDKAKRYDEAIETARKINSGEGVAAPPDWTVCEVVFPELKESEDERIRKDIKQHFLYLDDSFPDKAKWLAWLEKHGEQKPVELPKGEDYGIDGLYAAIDILKKTLGKVDGYQTDDGILEHKCAITAVKKLYNQKPAEWSEEDEKNLQGIIDEIEANKHSAPDYDLATYDRFLSWLKSLRPKNTWKPSDEQLDALHDAAVYVDKSMFPYPKEILMKLYKQLKKLKEE
jgi:hypothetical protein